MLSPRIVACLDVNAGRVVKGTRFVDLRDRAIRWSWPRPTAGTAPMR